MSTVKTADFGLEVRGTAAPMAGTRQRCVTQGPSATIQALVDKIVERGPVPDADDSFVFSHGSDEFEVLMLLLERFLVISQYNAQPGMSRDAGEALSDAFEVHVTEQYAALAQILACDPTVYDAVVLEWSGS